MGELAYDRAWFWGTHFRVSWSKNIWSRSPLIKQIICTLSPEDYFSYNVKWKSSWKVGWKFGQTACGTFIWKSRVSSVTNFNAVHSRIHRLAKDQTEINRIISEVSKGSKFYEVRTPLLNTLCVLIWRETLQNEKKKDKELTERIEKILKQRDEVIRGVDLRKPSVILHDVSSIMFYR